MRYNSKFALTLCVLLIVLLVIGKMDIYNYYSDNGYKLDNYIEVANKRDSITADIRKIQNKLDSANKVKIDYVQGFKEYIGSSSNFIGLFKIKEFSSKDNNAQQYLKLCNVGLKIQETKGPDYLTYYTKNGQGYLSTTKLTKIGNVNKVSYVDQKVGYRYSHDDNSILIPVKAYFWTICFQFSIYFTFLFFLIGYLLLLKLFFEFLIAVSRNSGFKEKNVFRLRTMSIMLLVLGCITYFINFLIYLIFSTCYSIKGVTITYSFWSHDYLMIILSSLCYLIYVSFKQGMILQQEQELTI